MEELILSIKISFIMFGIVVAPYFLWIGLILLRDWIQGKKESDYKHSSGCSHHISHGIKSDGCYQPNIDSTTKPPKGL